MPTASWPDRAACKGADTNQFFPTRANTPTAHSAAQWCIACPVAAECLNAAIHEDRTSGIRGGHYFDEGKHRPIGETDPGADGRRNARRQLAEARRRDALTRFHQTRAEHPNDTMAYRALAAHYSVTVGCAREWIRMARAELNAELTARHVDTEDAG